MLAMIPGHLPKAWVTGLLLWCVEALLFVPGIVFALLHWQPALLAVLALMFLAFLCFMGCIVWFMVERMLGRVTPWRRHA
ncbi:MAG TPA: hypothetical protein VGU65_08120 [Frateuria sp.]|uniref:hypothetical protein n=1 Tax=Frateuria sp. TaxID=2211372 RepID=UPI002DE299CF|nr:hypothetical protein [Frateuria sp.]